MNSAAYNSERITYHQISMYEYEFCTSTAINQNIDRINPIMEIYYHFCQQIILFYYFNARSKKKEMF